MLIVQVVDTWIGIMSKDKDYLFKKFGKLYRTAEMNSDGLGLGLMICKSLVEQNNGTISVYSEGQNRGSTFSFSMKMECIGGQDELGILKQDATRPFDQPTTSNNRSQEEGTHFSERIKRQQQDPLQY